MALNEQIGGSQEAKLLYAISKQLERLNGIASKASGGGGGGGTTLNQIVITTSANITTDTLDANGASQFGKNVIIDNGATAITITVNDVGTNPVSYQKEGTGVITFVAGAGRTLRAVDGTLVFNGAVGSTATLTSFGTIDSLRISNA